MKRKCTDEQLDFLRTGYQAMTVPELTRAFNARYGLALAESAVQSTLRNHGIRCGRKTGNTRGRYRVVTREQARYIEDNYKRFPLADLLEEFNRQFAAALTPRQLKTFIRNHGITSGRTGCFPKGHLPYNTGTKGLTHGNCTSFKKGHKPKNWTPLGTERITRDGYIEIKVPERNPYTGGPTRYRLKHRVAWEQTHGRKLPAGMVVFFLDGEKTNCAPGNLELFSRAEEVRLNQFGYHKLPAELRPNMLALVKLVTRAGNLRRAAREAAKR